MYENDLYLTDSYKRETKGAISNLKYSNNTTKKNSLFDPENEKTLLLVEKLSKKNKKFGKFRQSLTREELKLIIPNINESNDIDIDNKLAFHLANNVCKRRFRYFGDRFQDEDEDSFEINNIEKIKYQNELLRIEKERLEKERKEKERLEKERLEQEKKEKKRLERERLEKERLEKERLEKEKKEKERLEKERLEKEKKEKEKQREFMKTIEIKIEERNRENHNYKIIKKLTTEVEITNEHNNELKPKEEAQESHFQRTFINNIDTNEKKSKTININNRLPHSNTSKIITKKDIRPDNNTKIENRKIIVVNKTEYDKKPNNDKDENTNLTKNIIQKNIVVNKIDQYQTENNVRSRYKKKLNNIQSLDEL